MALFNSMTGRHNRLIFLNFCGYLIYENPNEAAGKSKNWRAWCSLCDRVGANLGVARWRIFKEGWNMPDFSLDGPKYTPPPAPDVPVSIRKSGRRRIPATL